MNEVRPLRILALNDENVRGLSKELILKNLELNLRRMSDEGLHVCLVLSEMQGPLARYPRSEENCENIKSVN